MGKILPIVFILMFILGLPDFERRGLIKEKLISWVKGIDGIVRWVIIVPCRGLI